MVYRNDGSSHHDGIKGECTLIHMINTDPKFSVIKEKIGKLEHKGGTKSTADAVSERGVRISIKTKNSNSGSFDWFNKSYVHDTETDTKSYSSKKTVSKRSNETENRNVPPSSKIPEKELKLCKKDITKIIGTLNRLEEDAKRSCYRSQWEYNRRL